MFISFEGIDGAGKTTLLSTLEAWLKKERIAHVVTREPGGTRLGEKVRELLLDPSHTGMSDRAELLLYSASRAQLVQEVIRPALNEGHWVLADRFIDATLAYQGYGRGLDLEMLRAVQEWATDGLWPHRTVLVDCDLEVAAGRQKLRPKARDRIESEHRAFHRAVREGYLGLADREPERFTVIDGSKPLDEVLQDFETAFWRPLRLSIQ
ncbi:MAG: dTMP kinase [Syntrophobacteraceae bacterium]